MHIVKETDAEQRRSRRKSTRAPIAASSIAAFGACSGVSTKNDPEAERIVKRAMQEEKDPTELPFGAKDISGGEDTTVVAKVQISISGFDDRRKAAFDAAWRTDADKKLGVFTYKADRGNGRTFDLSLHVQQTNGVYVVYRQLDGKWVRKSCRRKELIDALEDKTMSPHTANLLKNVKGLTHAKSGNTHVIKRILDADLSERKRDHNIALKRIKSTQDLQ